MSSQPFMPLFFGDFLASTAEWSGEEQALYLLLLAHQWSIGSLPADPDSIRKLSKFDRKTFKKCWKTVSMKFSTIDGRLINETLERHRQKSQQISEKRALAGAKGGSTRVAKAKQNPSNCLANASVLYSHPYQTIPRVEISTDISPSNQEINPPSPLPGGGLVLEPEAPEEGPKKPVYTAGFEEFWQVYPRKVGKLAASKAYSRAVRILGAQGRSALESAVKRYAAVSRNADPQFIPHPATWLNQGRWDDSPASMATSGAVGRDAFGVGG